MGQQEIYCWYNKQPIPTPVRLESSAPIPELVLIPERNVNGKERTKNYRRKIKLINEYGCICTACYAIKDVEDLTLDHIHPKFICPEEDYNTKQNWQLLCINCHSFKSEVERLFLTKVYRKVIESMTIGIRVLNLSELLQEFKELISKWSIRNRLLPIIF